MLCDCIKKRGDAGLVNASATDLQATICSVTTTLNDYNLSSKALP